ncbi:MAG: hypothetical protein NVS4B3_08000 [Gemmatimonadaceae bacterium]
MEAKIIDPFTDEALNAWLAGSPKELAALHIFATSVNGPPRQVALVFYSEVHRAGAPEAMPRDSRADRIEPQERREPTAGAGSGERRRRPTTTSGPAGELLFRDDCDREWTVYDRRGADRRHVRRFVLPGGETRDCVLEQREVIDARPATLQRQLGRAVAVDPGQAEA